jgi:two-component system, sensor histidine kinase SagS
VTSWPQFVVVGKTDSQTIAMLKETLREGCELLIPQTVEETLSFLRSETVPGVIIPTDPHSPELILPYSKGLLDQFPEGIALLDRSLCVQWANREFEQLVGSDSNCRDEFYSLLGLDNQPPPAECPISASLGDAAVERQTIRVKDTYYFEVQSRLLEGAFFFDQESLILMTVRDVSEQEISRQKLNAISRAGLDLGDLSPQDIADMTEVERVELLKSKILYYTQDILKYDTIEVRLIDKKTGRLDSLLQVGMQPLAADRELYAAAEDNGVTGFVAKTGQSYLCKDITSDPLYLPGAHGARSSLTVPLILHEEVLGTFNVESPEPDSFDSQDLQFLELFSREIAAAINTLDLLLAERQQTALESTQLILKEIAKPVDQILNDSAWMLEQSAGADLELCKRLQRVLKDARLIRQLIHQAGQTLVPEEPPHIESSPLAFRPILANKRILVADEDELILQSAHELLERYGCVIETAHNAQEAFLMARSFDYDLVITDIRLPDANGYECFCELKRINEDLPILLMTGYGYDAEHCIVKARQEGLKGVVFKPFRLDLLLTAIEQALATTTLSPSE